MLKEVQRFVSVEGPATYQGVRVDNPTIAAYIKTMVKQGRRTEDIMRVVGMPAEVIHRYQEEHRRERDSQKSSR